MSYVLIIVAIFLAAAVTLGVYFFGRFWRGEFSRKQEEVMVKKKGLPSRTFFRRYLPEGMKKEEAKAVKGKLEAKKGADDYQWKWK